MNFFAHAVLAAEHNADSGYVLGSMFPDFCTMAGLKSRSTGHPLVDAGIAHHHLVDDVFHGSTGFVGWMGRSRDELEDAGLGLGPAMAVAHVGVELILDGWLSETESRQTVYREALNLGAELELELGDEGPRLRRLARRLVDAPFPEGYVEPDFVAERLRRILAPRPRLALDESSFETVQAWARRARDEAPQLAPALMVEVRDRLASRIDFRQPE